MGSTGGRSKVPATDTARVGVPAGPTVRASRRKIRTPQDQDTGGPSTLCQSSARPFNHEKRRFPAHLLKPENTFFQGFK